MVKVGSLEPYEQFHRSPPEGVRDGRVLLSPPCPREMINVSETIGFQAFTRAVVEDMWISPGQAKAVGWILCTCYEYRLVDNIGGVAGMVPQGRQGLL